MATNDSITSDAATDRNRKIAEQLAKLQRKVVREFQDVISKGYIRSCPLCGYEGQFAPAGMPPRLDCQCPSCNSRERHRLFKLWMDREQRITKGHQVLHFAPEPQLTRLLRNTAGKYVTADLMRNKVDLKLNIEALNLPDASFDVIVAHQILEHVDHDKALAECFRCLRPAGFMVVTTPIIEGWEHTYENPEATTRRDRFLHFGQEDHVRYFGRDIRASMSAAGFEVEEHGSVEPDVAKYGLWRGETLFILVKPGKATPRKKKV